MVVVTTLVAAGIADPGEPGVLRRRHRRWASSGAIVREVAGAVVMAVAAGARAGGGAGIGGASTEISLAVAPGSGGDKSWAGDRVKMAGGRQERRLGAAERVRVGQRGMRKQ